VIDVVKEFKENKDKEIVKITSKPKQNEILPPKL
jgi:hypothetical protein